MSANKIVKRIVVRMNCSFVSPALVGSGNEENTDSDVLVTGDGKPFLPGSTIAGVLRATLDELDAKLLFGKSEKKGNENITKLSPLWTYDAGFEQGKIISLDGVALNEDMKTAKDKSKYDYEAIADGTKFKIRLMLVIRENDDKEKLERLLGNVLDTLLAGDISVGAKTNRGFGQIQVTDAEKKEFVFRTLEDVVTWANFKWQGEWNESNPAKLSDEYQSKWSAIHADLKLKGSIMIRDTHNISSEGEDYAHMESGGEPVIFGTSWAGAIKHGLFRLGVNKTYLDEVFGRQEENEGKATTYPSKIKILGSAIKDSEWKTITRVKIDRFTGGASDGALFTERPCFGGKTKLIIRFKKDDDQKAIAQLMLLAIDAINKGLITLGGETSVGRGVFEVTNIALNGVDLDVNIENLHQLVKPELKGKVSANG